MTRLLIVTADDLGLHRGMNEGAIRAHREGIVTAGSIVANGREFEHAVDLLRTNPDIAVGVHLTWVEERPLSGMTVSRSWRRFLARYVLGRADLPALERELRLQIEKVLAAGLAVTHLNSHQHLHVLPGISSIVHRLASEFAISYVRNPIDHGYRRRRAAMPILAMLARRAGFHGNDRTIGIGDAGHLTAGRLLDLLNHVTGRTELVTHPGVGEIGKAYDWGYGWNSETEALCQVAVRERMERLQITLGKPW